MKNIAVIIHGFTVEYSIDILRGITDYFKDKNVRLIVGQTKTPHSDAGIFEYHCWANAHFLSSSSLDAVIIITGSFIYHVTNTKLSDIFKIFSSKPVISISTPLALPDVYYTKIDCDSIFSDTIKHLKEIHGCSKIAFFSGNPIKASEFTDRFNAYQNGLKANGLDFDENLVLDGYLIPSSAEKILLTKYKTKEEIPFDSIICVNDSTAIGCVAGLKKLGVKIPEEIKVIGYDNNSLTYTTSPTLSTIDPDVYTQGYYSAELAYKKVLGGDIQSENLFSAKPLYRQSCGCLDINHSGSVYKDDKLNLHNPFVDNTETKSSLQSFNFLGEIDNVYTLFDMIQSATTMLSLFSSMKYLMNIASVSSCAICLYEKPVNLEREDDFTLPEKMFVEMYIDNVNKIQIFEPNISFNPKKTLFPDGFFDNQHGNYLIQPVFSGTTQYGYILCHLTKDIFVVYNIFIKILTNAITHAYEYTNTVTENIKLSDENKKLHLDNSNLSKKSKTDELTKVLNRRGFMELGQQTMNIALEMGNSGLVFFADMDNLKFINDTYGHKIGDIAIKAQATVLTQAMRANDVVGRIGGDEFAIIANGMKPNQIDKIRQKVQELSKVISKEKGFEFELSCSFGVYQFDEDHQDLKELLKEADKNMYHEKREKHRTRK